MKKLLVTSLGLVAWAHIALAQTQADTTMTAAAAAPETVKKASLYFGGGVALPLAPSQFSDYWKMGVNIGGGLGYAFSPSLAFVGQLDYSSFALNGDAILTDAGLAGLGVSITGGTIAIITVSGNLKANLIATPNTVSPYFIGGIGYSHMSASDFTITDGVVSITGGSDAASAFSVLFGAGLDIPAGEVLGFFLEGRYGILLTEEESTNYFPLRAGIKVKL